MLVSILDWVFIVIIMYFLSLITESIRIFFKWNAILNLWKEQYFRWEEYFRKKKCDGQIQKPNVSFIWLLSHTVIVIITTTTYKPFTVHLMLYLHVPCGFSFIQKWLRLRVYNVINTVKIISLDNVSDFMCVNYKQNNIPMLNICSLSTIIAITSEHLSRTVVFCISQQSYFQLLFITILYWCLSRTS